jgi:membrane protein implicated in regulation of membrane protease activity
MRAYVIWFLIGAAFLFLEMQLPGFILFFFAIGAWIAALAVAFLDISLSQQILIFTVSSVVSLIILRAYLKRVFHGHLIGSAPDGEFDDRVMGSIVSVVEPIRPNTPGKVKYRGSYWKAYSDEVLQAGDSARIVSYAEEGHAAFRVRKVEE